MNRIESVLQRLGNDPRCTLLPPSGQPTLPDDVALPSDITSFYTACGGADLFKESDFSATLVSPDRFRPATAAIVGGETPPDRSDHWFIVAEDSSEPLVVIDLAPDRLGRCYDAFREIYGIAGSMSVLASSFTDLVEALLANEGTHWFWLDSDWKSLGDAYD